MNDGNPMYQQVIGVVNAEQEQQNRHPWSSGKGKYKVLEGHLPKVCL